jgi:hypothetical protein
MEPERSVWKRKGSGFFQELTGKQELEKKLWDSLLCRLWLYGVKHVHERNVNTAQK